jgi:hypothetical protein
MPNLVQTIKAQIEDQQLTGKMDLGTTWEQNPPKNGVKRGSGPTRRQDETTT